MGSRKPAPTSTHLLKGDPDSATSPSKYLPLVASPPGQELSPFPPLEPDAAVTNPAVPPLDFTMAGFSSSDEEEETEEEKEEEDDRLGRPVSRRRRLRKRKSRRDMPSRGGGRLAVPVRSPADESAKKTNKTVNSEPKLSLGGTGGQLSKAAAGRQGRPPINEPENAPGRKKKLYQQKEPPPPKEKQKKPAQKGLTVFDLKDFLSKRKIVHTGFNMDIVMKQVKRLQKEEEDIEEVEGSLTSASTVRSLQQQQQLRQLQQVSPQKRKEKAAGTSNKFQALVKLAVKKERFPNM